ncbi:hypothetical protein [Clostridioides sp. ZZV14-6045]
MFKYIGNFSEEEKSIIENDINLKQIKEKNEIEFKKINKVY